MLKLSLILSILILSSPLAMASSVKCYSGGKLIYTGDVKDLVYNETFIIMTDCKTGKDIFVTGDCVIKV